MAFLWCDSFDHYTSTTDFASKYPAPGSRGGSCTIVAAAGRRGTACYRAGGSSAYIVKSLAGVASGVTCITGFSMKPGTIDNASGFMEFFDSAGTSHVSLKINTDGSISALRSSTVLGTSAVSVIQPATGYHAMECKITVSDTVGVVVVKVNGTTVLNLSGLDTRNAGVLEWARISLGQNAARTYDFDDWWVCDGSGSAHNDFLGDMRVDVHYPNAAGSNNASTPSTGSDRSATIDETAPNGDTDYNTVTSVGDKDTVNIQALANTGATPAGVLVTVYARKTDAGAGSLGIVTRQGGTDRDHAAFAQDTAYAYTLQQAFDAAPDGSAWTETIFNALEVGYKRTA